ncbi:MAG: 4Fe-4S dicluster domain-containing protein [Candidatus Eisenbacteria bacterium]|nr:4Fe-4S dicluster domain-containing protein [Candidatus Eisenbacteria bacterium]
MRDWVLERASLPSFIDFLSKRWKVVAPQRRNEIHEFRELEDPADLCLDYPTTMLPPSRVFLPDGEVLYRFQPNSPGSAAAAAEERPIALFGVHTCDLEGISVMDEIYLAAPIDRAYARRREGAFIVGIECAGPCVEENLCADKGTNHTERVYDLLLHPVDEKRFVVWGRTNRGNDVAEESGLFRPATHQDHAALDDFRAAQARMFRPKFGLRPDELSARVRASWDDLLWVAQSRLCISCGACNVVCPTCHCFTTRDHLPIREDGLGERCRYWTGCQLESFAKVASGENFREKKSQRLRHRIFKKEVYGMDRFGRSGCVGCGRCGHFCPADIRLVEIFGQLSGKEVTYA